MADDKKKKKKKAPPVLTPEQRRELAEKQVIGAGMALDFRDQARSCWRASPMTRRVRLRRRNTVPRRRRSPRTAGRLPMKLRWRPRRLR